MRLTDFLQDVGTRCVPLYPNISKMCGGVAPGVLFMQLLYWADKTNDPEGWIYKTRLEIEDETALTQSEQETARRLLRERGFLYEKFGGMPRKLFYRLDLETVNMAWEERKSLEPGEHASNLHKGHFTTSINDKMPLMDEAAPILHKGQNAPYISDKMALTEEAKWPLNKRQNAPAYTLEYTLEKDTLEKDTTPPTPTIVETAPIRGEKEVAKGQRRKAQPSDVIPPWSDDLPWPNPISLVSLYNAMKPDGWSLVESVAGSRLRKCEKYLKDYPKKDWWLKVMENLPRWTWLQNRLRRESKNFDWLVKEGRDEKDNCLKVQEGHFLETKTPTSTAQWYRDGDDMGNGTQFSDIAT